MELHVTKFSFESLPQYDDNDLKFNRLLQRIYNVDFLSTDWLKPLSSVFCKLLRRDVTLTYCGIRKFDSDELLEDEWIGTPVGEILLKPKGTKLYFSIDTWLLKIFIQQTVLDGTFDFSQASQLVSRPLTALESAASEFILASILKEGSLTQWLGGNSTQLSSFLPKASADFFATSQFKNSFVTLSYRIACDGRDFYFRFLVPIQHLEDRFGRQDEGFEAQRLLALGRSELEAYLSLGSVQLTGRDIADLSEGDIVLVDRFKPKLDGKRLSGECDVIVGSLSDEATRMNSEIVVNDNEKWILKVTN